MADKSSLQRIGWAFGALTAAVVLTAALIVTNATAGNNTPSGMNGEPTQIAGSFSAIR